MILHINLYTEQKLLSSECLIISAVDERRNLYRLSITDKKIQPRFYVAESDVEILKHVKTVMGKSIISWQPARVPDRFGQKTVRVDTQFKSDVPDARAFFTNHYQAGIEWHKMAMIELGLWEWIDVDMKRVKWGFVPIDAIQPAKDPGWDWEGRTCWFDSEWDASELDHVPKPWDAAGSKCIIIACIDDVTEKGVIFSIHDKAGIEKSDVDTRLKTSIPPRIHVEKRMYMTEVEMLEGFIEWFSKQGFDTIGGHNTSGGWIVANKRRVWRNGFDLPLLHERCKLLGVDDSRLSPLGVVYGRQEESKYEIIIKGVLLFDWLYAWKFTQYGKYQERIVNGKKIRLRGNGLDELGRFYFDRGKARGNEELKMFYPSHAGKTDISRYPVWTLHKYFPDVADYYCLQDAILSWGLDRHHHVKHDVLSVAYLVGAPPEDAMMATRYHKVYTYRLLRDKMVLETDLLNMSNGRVEEDTDDDEDDDEDEKYGAFVPDVKKGLWDNVLDLDFSGMYPSIYQTMNAGVDTLFEPERWTIKEGKFALVDKGGRVFDLGELIFSPSGAIFRKTAPGSVQRVESVDRYIFTRLGEDRKSAKKERDKHPVGSAEWIRWEGFQKRVKVAMNSRFGVAITPIFNTATLTGQFLLKSVISFLGPERVVGGDTDGLHVKLVGTTRQELVADAEKIVKEVNLFVDKLVREEFGVEKNYLQMVGETIADRILYHAKKMYMERVVWEKGKWLPQPYYEYRGFKVRRSDSSEAMDSMFEDVRDIVFQAADERVARKEVEKYFKSFHEKFKTMQPMEMAVSKTLSKYIDQYGNTFESRAANFTKYYYGKEYLPGETFYILSVADFPANLNKKPILPSLMAPKPAIAFDETSMHFLENIQVDVSDMERLTVKAVEPFTEFLAIDYNKTVSLGGGLFR